MFPLVTSSDRIARAASHLQHVSRFLKLRVSHGPQSQSPGVGCWPLGPWPWPASLLCGKRSWREGFGRGAPRSKPYREPSRDGARPSPS